MAQTKLLNIVASVAAQIGDTGYETYAQADVLKAVNEARGKIYLNYLQALGGDIGKFMEVFPEWVFENVMYITAITGTTTLTITTSKPHRLISGQLITITEVTGFGTNPNGNYAVLGTGLTENKFQITHTVVSGSYTSGGKIVMRLSNNELNLPIDCRTVISGLLNSSSPSITNGLIKKLTPEIYHEAKVNVYSPFAPANDAVKMYQKNTTIEIMVSSAAAITGNAQIIYLGQPTAAVIDATYNDIPDPEGWYMDTLDLASELIMSYELQ